MPHSYKPIVAVVLTLVVAVAAFLGTYQSGRRTGMEHARALRTLRLSLEARMVQQRDDLHQLQVALDQLLTEVRKSTHEPRDTRTAEPQVAPAELEPVTDPLAQLPEGVYTVNTLPARARAALEARGMRLDQADAENFMFCAYDDTRTQISSFGQPLHPSDLHLAARYLDAIRSQQSLEQATVVAKLQARDGVVFPDHTLAEAFRQEQAKTRVVYELQDGTWIVLDLTDVMTSDLFQEFGSVRVSAGREIAARGYKTFHMIPDPDLSGLVRARD